MKLNAEELQQFHAQGYVILPHFFTTPEVTAMRAELERLKQDGLLRNVSTAGDGKTRSAVAQNLQICPLSPKSEFYRALPFCPKVIEVVRQLIGDPVQHHLDQIFLKPGRHGAGTNWHQDNAYFAISDPTKGVGMWVALHDATVANGTMHIIPGIYRERLVHQRDGDSDHHIRCYPNEDKAIPIEMEAGGALFFNYGVPHCTRGNTTDRERAGLALHFLRTDFRNPEKKRDYNLPILTGPEATGGLAEWKVKVEGTWDAQVARLLASAPKS